MSTKRISPEIVDLCFRLSEGTLTEAQAPPLRRWLTESHANQMACVELFTLLAGLEWQRSGVTRDSFSSVVSASMADNDAAAGIAIPGLNEAAVSPVVTRPIPRELGASRGLAVRHTLISILCVVIVYYGLVALVFWGVGSPRTAAERRLAEARVPLVQPEELPLAEVAGPDEPLARLDDARDCVWQEPPASSLHSGDWLQLASGQAEVQFSQGARVVLEGPSELEIRTASTCFLHSGRLLAQVPRQAIGFTLETSSLQVVDLGTEFGVHVDAAGQAEVHVFKGKVKARPVRSTPAGTAPAGDFRMLAAGEGMRAEPDSQGLVPLAADRKPFPAAPQAVAAVELLGFYPFDGDARDAAGDRQATTVSETDFVPGKEGQAAWFAGKVTSHVDFPIDASVEAEPDLTWGAWVKPAAVVNSQNEILSTDDGDFDRVLTIDNRRGVHEQPTYRFSALAGPSVGSMLSRGPLPSPDHWTFVAAVYRAEQQTVMLYVEDPALNNGQGGLVSDMADQVEIGPSRKTVRVGGHFDREESFHGGIDNVFIFRGALGHRELEQIRREGAAAIRRLGGLNVSTP